MDHLLVGQRAPRVLSKVRRLGIRARALKLLTLFDPRQLTKLWFLDVQHVLYRVITGHSNVQRLAVNRLKNQKVRSAHSMEEAQAILVDRIGCLSRFAFRRTERYAERLWHATSVRGASFKVTIGQLPSEIPGDLRFRIVTSIAMRDYPLKIVPRGARKRGRRRK